MHNCIVFWKRPKTNEKDAGDGPGKKQDYELSSNFSEINLFCFCRVCVCVLHKLQWTINQLQMQFTFLLLLQFVVAKFFRQFIVNFLTFIYLFWEPKNLFQVFNDRDVDDDDASAFVFVLLLLLFSISLSFSLSRVIHGHKIEAAHLLLLHCKQKWKGKLGTPRDLFLARACLLVSYYCITRVLRATKGQVSHGPVFIAVFASSRCDIFWCTSRA